VAGNGNTEQASCDFFVSYTGADVAWAEWIAWQLTEGGYQVRIQKWHFRPGGNFVRLMHDALEECTRTLAVISQAYLESVYGSDEWTAAFTHDQPGRSSLLLVRVDQVELPRLLGPWIRIDLGGLEEAEAATRLLEGVQPGPLVPTVAPRFPGGAPAAGGPGFPGQPPAIFNAPHRNPQFTGREELLEQLRVSLAGGRQAAAVVGAQALYGLGGVGKTQLAVEYAHRYAASYQLVWWIQAEQPATIPGQLAQLATKLGLPQLADQEQLVAVLLEALRRQEGWLLVFDNATAPQDLEPYWPPNSGHVLVTSRNPGWGSLGRTLHVDVWPRDQAVAFLLRRTDSTDQTVAAALAGELGDLPLALEQAAAYIERQQLTLDRYLELFGRRRGRLLGEGTPAFYQRTVQATFGLATDELDKASPAVLQLLELCAFLAPEAIPLDLLSVAPDLLPAELAAATADELEVEAAVGVLVGYALVDRDPGGLRVHRLVQAVVADWLGDQEKAAWVERTVGLLQAAVPDPQELAGWGRWAQLLAHVLAAAGHAEQTSRALAPTALLLTDAGIYLAAQGEYRAARDGFERALAIRKAALGPAHPQVATDRTNLGNVLAELGDLTGARAQLEQALAIHEAALGPTHVAVADDCGNLGNVLFELGDLTGARAQLERALAIHEAALGPTHPTVASDRANLGGVLRELGDLTGACTQHERALAIHEAALGPIHPAVASDRANLGLVLADLGELADARTQLERALAVLEATLGAEHPHTHTVRVNLAGLARSGRRWRRRRR